MLFLFAEIFVQVVFLLVNLMFKLKWFSLLELYNPHIARLCNGFL